MKKHHIRKEDGIWKVYQARWSFRPFAMSRSQHLVFLRAEYAYKRMELLRSVRK